MTSMGRLLRSGKALASVPMAAIDSGLLVKLSSLLSAPGRLNTPSASAPSSTTPVTSTATGRLPAELPITAKTLKVCCLGSLPYAGISGQNTRRPSSTRTAGNSVIIAMSAHSTPTAPTGPRPRMLLRSAASRQASPATTVPQEASTAGPQPRSAVRIASWGRGVRRSSSR